MAFRSVNERICWIEVDVGGTSFAFISFYMPHGGCPDSEVEHTYMLLSQTIRMARRRGKLAVAVGDWNAVVGRREDAQDPVIIGEFGTGLRNSRGRWMASWSCTEKMRIISTHFD